MFCILLALSHNVLWTFPRITLCRPSLLFGWITLHSICVYHSLSVPSSEVAQSCLTLCDPMDCSLLRSSVYGIFQARVLECVAISFSRGSSWPRDRTQVSRTVGRHFTVWATRKRCVGQWLKTESHFTAWIELLALLLTSCLSSERLFNLSGPQFPH